MIPVSRVALIELIEPCREITAKCAVVQGLHFVEDVERANCFVNGVCTRSERGLFGLAENTALQRVLQILICHAGVVHKPNTKLDSEARWYHKQYGWRQSSLFGCQRCHNIARRIGAQLTIACKRSSAFELVKFVVLVALNV